MAKFTEEKFTMEISWCVDDDQWRKSHSAPIVEMALTRCGREVPRISALSWPFSVDNPAARATISRRL
jgi:hypothetical protein